MNLSCLKVTPIPIKIEISDDDDDDVITLTGCGITTKWKIPLNMERCPVLRCGAVFKVRSDLINHYKFQHAKGSILCEICIKPIRAERTIDFTEHFKRRHPSSKIPYNLDGTPRSKVCQCRTYLAFKSFIHVRCCDRN